MSGHSEPPIFDPQTLQQLRELVDADDPSFLAELFESYLSTANENIETLRHESDEAVLRRAAHTLKGSSLNVGASRVAELCKQLEQAIAVRPPSDMPQRVAQIEKQVQQVTDAYQETIVALMRNSSDG